MPQLGPLEILVVAIVALMVFGPKRLPEVGRQVGHGLRELRKIQETVRAEIHDVLNAPDSPSNADAASDDAPSRGALPVGYRTSGTPSSAGRVAPSRFRPGATSGHPASSKAPPNAALITDHVDEGADRLPAVAEPADQAAPTPPTGTRAPSRFRAPGA